jgi:hypothetical protein
MNAWAVPTRPGWTDALTAVQPGVSLDIAVVAGAYRRCAMRASSLSEAFADSDGLARPTRTARVGPIGDRHPAWRDGLNCPAG